MIKLWPAIDLINATSVRLTEGKYDSEEKWHVPLKKVYSFTINFSVLIEFILSI